jgi:hypothetical protein
MAIALIGGLVTSTVLTLVALPAFYELSEGFREQASKLWLKYQGELPSKEFVNRLSESRLKLIGWRRIPKAR